MENAYKAIESDFHRRIVGEEADLENRKTEKQQT